MQHLRYGMIILLNWTNDCESSPSQESPGLLILLLLRADNEFSRLLSFTMFLAWPLDFNFLIYFIHSSRIFIVTPVSISNKTRIFEGSQFALTVFSWKVTWRAMKKYITSHKKGKRLDRIEEGRSVPLHFWSQYYQIFTVLKFTVLFIQRAKFKSRTSRLGRDIWWPRRQGGGEGVDIVLRARSTDLTGKKTRLWTDFKETYW